MPYAPNAATDWLKYKRTASHTVDSTTVHTLERTDEHAQNLAGYFQRRMAR